MSAKKKTITIDPQIEFRARVNKLAADAKAAQESFADAVLNFWALTGEEGSCDSTDLLMYRGKMVALQGESRDLRAEAERNNWTPPTADVLTHPAKEIFGRAWGLGRINPRLRPGVIKPREDTEELAKHSHDKSIGFAERI